MIDDHGDIDASLTSLSLRPITNMCHFIDRHYLGKVFQVLTVNSQILIGRIQR